MAVRGTDIREFRQILEKTRSRVIKGHGLALIETAQKARELAIKNAKKQFKGDPRIGRRLTGQLFKSIKVRFDRPTGVALPKAFLTVEGIPYGAAQEFGATITPKRAKNLWVKSDYNRPFKRLTPTEFIKLRETQKRENRSRDRSDRSARVSYDIFKSKKGNLIAARVERLNKRAKVRPLFVLKKQVKLPERPYLRPAAEEAAKGFAEISRKRIREQFSRR